MARFNVRIHCCVWFPFLSNYCCMYTTSLLWFFLLLIYAPMWPDLAKFCHFGTTLKNFAHFETFILDLEKLFNLLWQNLHANGQILIVGNGQISTNNPATWSHCICPFLRQFVHPNLFCLPTGGKNLRKFWFKRRRLQQSQRPTSKSSSEGMTLSTASAS